MSTSNCTPSHSQAHEAAIAALHVGEVRSFRHVHRGMKPQEGSKVRTAHGNPGDFIPLAEKKTQELRRGFEISLVPSSP